MSDVTGLRGYVASISLTGSVTPQFAMCLMEMRSYCDKHKLTNIEWKIEHGVLIEAARDAVVQHALDPLGNRTQPAYDWVLQVDADATFPPETVHRLLEQAYVNHPDADVMGAYCQLKPYPHLPTIDSGTGTWEEHYPGEGVIPVIRTGAHCFLTKISAFNKLGPGPWFRTRLAQRPVQAFAEVDGFVRQRLHGENPFRRIPEWATMLEEARVVSESAGHVGEDSAFFDRCLAFGIKVYCDTDLVTGHVSQKVITPKDFSGAVRLTHSNQLAALGVGR